MLLRKTLRTGMFLAFCCSHKVYWLGNLCACALLSSSHCLLTAWGGQWKTHTEDLLWASSHSTAHPSSPLPRPLCQPEARDTQPSPLSWEPDPGPPVYFISRTQLFQNGNFHPSSQTCFYPLRFPAVVNGLWESWVFLDTFVFQIQFNIKTKTHHFLPSALSPPRSFEPNPLTLVGYCKSHYLISAYLANVPMYLSHSLCVLPDCLKPESGQRVLGWSPHHNRVYRVAHSVLRFLCWP